MVRRLRSLSACVVAMCVILTAPGVCFAVAVNVTAPTGPIVVAKGETVQFTFSAADSSPPSASSLPGEPPTPCPISGPNWSWQAGAGSGSTVSVAPPGTASSVTVNASFSNVGTYTLSATATASYTDSPCTHNYTGGGSGSVEVQVVDIDVLQYQNPSGSWLSLPNPMYVLAGSTLAIRAVPTPGNSIFPSGKPVWGGSSGASGSTDATSVTFSSASTSSSDYKTVTCTCGSTSITKNVIVYDLTPTVTPVDNFAGRDLSNFGVCEYLNLGYQIAPAGVTEYQIGGLQWELTSGGGSLSAGSTGTYQCPDVEATVTLNIVINEGPMVGQRKGPGPVGIWPPEGHKVRQRVGSDLWHILDHVSVKFQGDFWAISGTAVSFKEIECSEGRSTFSVANGFFNTNEIPWNHIRHEPTGSWFPLGVRETGGEYKWQAPDGDKSGFGEPIDLYKKWLDVNFPAGDFTWDVFMMYRKIKVGEIYNEDPGHFYAAAPAPRECNTDGKAKTDKGNAGPFEEDAEDEGSNYWPTPP